MVRSHHVLVVALAWLAACDEGGATRTWSAPPEDTARDDAALTPLPLTMAADPARVALGRTLFHDVRLSHDDSTSCASCHSLDTGGCDRRVTSTGIGGTAGAINAPTVFNAALNFRQFWDGRAATLEAQIDGPIHAPGEMGSNWPEIVQKLSRDAAVVAEFEAVYGHGPSAESVRDALASFERSLITPNAPFDRFLRGDEHALEPLARDGYHLFTTYGCVACHQGVGVGGNMYQRFGVLGDYFADRGHLTDADLGRFATTGEEADRHVFKVPSLRNVARTAPYFHDGSAPTLDAAVTTMARYQLGRELDENEVHALVAFLESLTGEYDGRPL